MISQEKLEQFNGLVITAAKEMGIGTVVFALSEEAEDGGCAAGVITKKIDPKELATLMSYLFHHVEENFISVVNPEARA